MSRHLGEALLQGIAELEEREQAIATAAEQLSQDAAVKAAYACGQATERGRILTMIQYQLDTLQRAGHEALCLRALARNLRAGDDDPH